MDKDMSLYQKKIKENISILINENKLHEAKEVLSQYESIISNDTDVYSTKAVIYMMEGNIEQAEQVLVEGLNASKGNFDLLYNLAYLYQSKGEIETAIEYYKKAFWNAKAEEDRDSVYGILQELGIQETKQELLKNKVPKTSIVILTYNNLEYNKLCIESIREYTQKGTYEIIIVDNHSTDGTVEWLKEQKDLKLILNDENQGFPKGCNQGIEAAEEGNDILLLNNDTIVTPNWLDNLKQCLYSNEKIGAVGSVTNSCSNNQVISGKYNSIQEMFDFAKGNNISNPSQWEERIRLVGFCMLIKAEVVSIVGLLDEIFTPGNFEDDDYSYRIRKAGYRLMLCKDSFIHHFGSASFGKEAKKFSNLLVINREKFIKKWGVDPYSITEINEVFPLVSILIPTYNRPEYFRLALESALNQTYKNIEIIIGDDGTNSETEELVRNNYLNKYPNIKYYHNEQNIGQFDNDLKLYDMAEGEYINFLMDDDLFETVKIEKMMKYFIEDTAKEISLVTSHRAIIDDIGNKKGIFGNTNNMFKEDTVIDGVQLGNFMLKFNFNCIGEPTTVLFRKESLKESFGMFNGRRYGCNVDQASWLNLLAHNKAVFINEALSSFRIHSGQQQHDLKIMLRGFTDYVHQILTCREKGFLTVNEEYHEALERCINLCEEYIFNPIKQEKISVEGYAEYEQFLKLHDELITRHAEFQKRKNGSKAKKLPLVSILIPAYNQTKYLKAALESAINQTYSNIEIIIGDDSTTNEVEEFIQPYLKTYGNIVYYKNKRTGMDYGVSNVEGLFKRSRGEYINYLFHDDIFHITKIEKMMNHFLSHENISLITSHRQLIDENGKLLPDNEATKRIFENDTLVSGSQLSLVCLENLTNFIGEPTTVLFKKSLLEQGFGHFNGNSYTNIGDIAMWLSLLKKGHAIYMRESLSYFRQHSSQNSQKPEVYLMGVIEWENIIVDSYKAGLFTSNKIYKDIISKWFYKFNFIMKNVAFMELEYNLKLRLQEVFKNAIDIMLNDEGYRHKCLICNKQVDRFLPYNVAAPKSMDKYDIIGSDVENFSCPHCYSHDRERHLLMYFNKLNIWDAIKNKKVLHIAPEAQLKQIIKQMGAEEYVQGDLYPTDESITKVDITNIPFHNEYFDLIICNHVLEHIDDDAKAMSELYRVLKKGGYAILQTPYSAVLSKSYEDKNIKSSGQRLEKYGQEDHVRIYGLDLFTRLERTGFELNVMRNDELFSKDDCIKYGVNYRENLILVNKK